MRFLSGKRGSSRSCAWRFARLRPRLVAGVVTVASVSVAAGFFVAASATAARAPSAAEASKITKSLLAKFRSVPGVRIPRSRIRVSTVDPNYARAHVTPGKNYQPFYAVLAKRRGSWAVIDYGTDQVGCSVVPSKRVRLDLLGCPGDGPSPATGAPAATGQVAVACSTATAKRLVLDRVAGVLCGSFLGADSRAMVVNLTSGVCLPFVGWEVYELKGGSWEHVVLPAHGGLSGHPVVKVGNDIRETLDVRRPGDSLCNPTGGTKTRIWHWNGSRLVPSVWTSSTKPSTPTTSGNDKGFVLLYSPSGNLRCAMRDHSTTVAGPDGVYCESVSLPHSATLRANGQLKICTGARCVSPQWPDQPASRELAYGRQIVVGRFRCRSEETGVTCVVIVSGKGFLIDRDGVKKVG